MEFYSRVTKVCISVFPFKKCLEDKFTQQSHFLFQHLHVTNFEDLQSFCIFFLNDSDPTCEVNTEIFGVCL